MQRKKEYTKEVSDEYAWIPRWKDEPTQDLRFLAEEVYARCHAGQYFTLICQEEIGLDCRLCGTDKPAKKSGFALVEKDDMELGPDGVVRMFKAGCKQFWEPFNKDHADDMKNHWFAIQYDKSYRLTPYRWKVGEDGSGKAFATEDDLEERLRGLAMDDIYTRCNIKPLKSQFGKDREPRSVEEKEERGESYIQIDDAEI